MKTRLFILLTALFGVVACSYDEADYFVDTRFIKFCYDALEGDATYYLTEYSFAYEDDTVTHKDFYVPVEFRGYDLEQDLTFRVEIDTDSTDMPDDCVQLNEEQIFHAQGVTRDSMKVTIFRRPILQEASKRVRIKLVSNENFQTYMQDSLYVEFVVGDIFMRPDWWTYAVEQAYLGTFSKEKYDAFVEVTGIREFGELDSSAKRSYALMFKRSLEANPRYESDGKTLMTVPIAG